MLQRQQAVVQHLHLGAGFQLEQFQQGRVSHLVRVHARPVPKPASAGFHPGRPRCGRRSASPRASISGWRPPPWLARVPAAPDRRNECPRPRPPAAPRRGPRRRRSACARRRARAVRDPPPPTRAAAPATGDCQRAAHIGHAQHRRVAPVRQRQDRTRGGHLVQRPVGKPSHSRCRRNTSNEARRNAVRPPSRRRRRRHRRPPARPAAAGGRGGAWRRWRTPGNCGSARTRAVLDSFGRRGCRCGSSSRPRPPARHAVQSRRASWRRARLQPARSRGRLPRRPARPDAAGLRDDWAAGTGPCGKRPAPGGHRPPHPAAGLADSRRRSRHKRSRCAPQRAIVLHAPLVRQRLDLAQRDFGLGFRFGRDGYDRRPAAPQGGPDGAWVGAARAGAARGRAMPAAPARPRA